MLSHNPTFRILALQSPVVGKRSLNPHVTRFPKYTDHQPRRLLKIGFYLLNGSRLT